MEVLRGHIQCDKPSQREGGGEEDSSVTEFCSTGCVHTDQSGRFATELFALSVINSKKPRKASQKATD